MDLILKKLSEPSTWLGILTIVGSLFGYVFSPELSAEIAAAATGIIGVIAIVLKDRRG
jgi:Mg2+ and Co2+ transporter CorA